LYLLNNIAFTLNNFNYGLVILHINVYIYIHILYLLFSVLFLYDTKKLLSLVNFKVLNYMNFISITVVLTFLSMSGIPPLVGFVGKFLIFNFLFLMKKYVFIFIFSLLNFFAIFFYIQNLRFLINKTQSNFFLISGFYFFFNKGIVNIIVLLNLVNFFGIFFLEDFVYILTNMLFFKSI